MEEQTEKNVCYYAVNWQIINFNFCWHKTGEYIESPTFDIRFPFTTSWRLRLYPRGEVDGEYISCYLYRDKEGPGPVDIDFSLYLYVEDSLVKRDVNFTKIYSFKNFQRVGLKRFALRSEIFAPNAAQKDKFNLTFGCKVFHPFVQPDEIVRSTKIITESIYGTEIIDDNSELDPERNKDIEVKPILRDKSLINLNLSYVDEYLIVKILPVNTEGVKYATCKIVVAKTWGDTTPIEHVSSWIGEIKTVVMKFHVPSPEVKCGKSKGEKVFSKALILYYDFAFSNGLVVNFGTEKIDDGVKNLNFSLLRSLDIKKKVEKPAPTAVEALREVYISGTYTNVTVETKSEDFEAHEAILCARSPYFKSIITSVYSHVLLEYPNQDHIAKFVQFFYTDQVEFEWVDEALALCHFATAFGIKLLEAKCVSFLKDRLDLSIIFEVLLQARSFQQQALLSVAEDFIRRNYALILGSGYFREATEKYLELREIIILLKYKKIKNGH